MVRKVLAGCRKLDPEGEFRRLVVGVSGGADSTALLHCLSSLRDVLGVELAAVHINHKARGAESDGDAAFVRKLCRELRVKCSIRSIDVAARARKRKISFEMAAREARYESFVSEARKAGPGTAVVTAHTRDDQAETVLLKLARGAGIRGLAGIPPRGEVDGVTVMRPMLDISREEIISFLRSRKLEWREDSSNSSAGYMRNRVRHRVLPLIEADLNPNAKTALARTAEVLREDDALMQALTEEALELCSVSGSELNLAELRQEHRAIVRRVIMTWLTANGLDSENIDMGLVGSIERLMVGRSPNASLKVAGGRCVVREYDRLCISTTGAAPRAAFSHKLKVPGRVLVVQSGLVVEAVEGKGVIKARGMPGCYPVKATISRKAVGRRSLTVRSWRPGDRIKPMGMNGSRKIKDVLIDLKVPAPERSRLPVVECAGEIVWVPGYRVARGWEVGPGEASVGISIIEA